MIFLERMDRAKEIFNWFIDLKRETEKEEIKKQFKLSGDEYYDIIRILEEQGIILEVKENLFITLEKAKIMKNKMEEEVVGLLKKILLSEENKQTTEVNPINDWEDIYDIEKFVIFDGAEKIYEIHVLGKIIKLEGKEIMDYNIFRLKFFEQFGVMLKSYRGIGQDWSNMISKWYRQYGEYSKDKTENISESEEAKDILIDYINNSTPSNNHILKEGIVCVKDDCIFLATKIVKKILKRNGINISMRKLAYVLDDYLLSGSMPIKIENKSERFWKLKKKMFNITDKSLEIQEELDE